MIMKATAVAALVASQALLAVAQTWCNKNYMANQSVVPPGGEFPTIGVSSQPLLAFRCAPAIKPYLAEDSSGSMIVDAFLTNSQVEGAVPFHGSVHSSTPLSVSISVNGKVIGTASVPLNSTGHEIPLSLNSFTPRKAAFDVTCTAKIENESFSTGSSLLRLPNPTTGGVTKMDMRTGAMLVRQSPGVYDTVFPIGFYTSFDGYIASNLSILNDLADRGFTIVHPVPTFDNLTALSEVIDRMEEVGLYLMYDMRFTYMNSTSVTEQVNMIKDRKNLLLWYTGDEPDGTFDPLNATTIAYDLINDLDGYHPVSLVLNCFDFNFPSYASGTDVVMQDTYPIAINATFSVEWHAPCTPDFGDCGCDDCKGEFEDISTRMDVFAQRLDALGESRTKSVWAVPQAFGGSEYWARAPTGNEWLVESVLSINHGAKGIVPWMDPNPQDIKDAATTLAKALPTIKPFIFDPTATFSRSTTSRIDVGLWTVGERRLLMATNLNNATQSISLGNVFPRGAKATEILNSGGSLSITPGGAPRLDMEALGSIVAVVQ